MTSIFTNDVDAGSFLGLVTRPDIRSTPRSGTRTARPEKPVFRTLRKQNREVVTSLTLGSLLIVMSIAGASTLQHKIETHRYAAPAQAQQS